jgi:uncharacterized protein (TIGR02996 family)
MHTFVYSDAKSHKFWNIELQGNAFTVTYGRVGATGQTQTKQFANAATARKEHDKLIKEKITKGYSETTSSAAKPSPEQEALEEALVENPGDLATHMAYADWLNEQGDPRGEFIQTQLALEDSTRPTTERKKLKAREKTLFKKHGHEWLGGLAAKLLDNEEEGTFEYFEPRYSFQFARGWLDYLQAEDFTVSFARTLAHSPQARLLRHLILVSDAGDEDEPDSYEAGDDIPARHPDHPAMYPLIRSRCLANVRILQIGEDQGDDFEAFRCYMFTPTLPDLVKVMPRLEELYVFSHQNDLDKLFGVKTLHNLRVLKVYHSDKYPLAILAKNPSLGRLTHLLCHPHHHRRAYNDDPDFDPELAYINPSGVRALLRSPHVKSLTHLQLRLSSTGDNGIKEIVNSGILKQLKVLDLRHGCVSDEGARALAECPDLANLERLDLNRNHLTTTGIQLLRKRLGKAVHADNQIGPNEDPNRYLFEGEFE